MASIAKAVNQKTATPSFGSIMQAADGLEPAPLVELETSDTLTSFLKQAENSTQAGFDKKTGKYLPHDSPEGGLKTIAYGHKLKKGEDYSEGLTEEQAHELLQNDIVEAQDKAKKLVPGFETLPEDSKQMLTEMAFNGVLGQFKEFRKAVIKEDWETAKQQYLRYYTKPDGTKMELKSRNDLFYDTFLKNK